MPQSEVIILFLSMWLSINLNFCLSPYERNREKDAGERIKIAF